MSENRIRMIVSGRVQGVFFRAFTCEEAQRLGLQGWVRNLPNGSVEVLAAGNPEKLEALKAICRQGPPYARVDHIEVFDEVAEEGPLSTFTIKY